MWFPSKFPANTLVLLSSSQSPDILERIQQYEWQKMEVDTISLKDKGVLVGKVMGQQGKALSKVSIIPNPLWGNFSSS